MSTLHAPASRFNPITPAGNPDTDSASGDVFDADFGASYVARTGALPDESTFDLDDDNARAELEAGIAEWELDNAIQSADESHLAELTKAIAKGKALYGNHPIRVQRCITAGYEAGVNPVEYFAFIDCRRVEMVVARGNTPIEAVENLGDKIDQRYNVAPEFAGFVVERIAYVAGPFERSTDEAHQLARRIALDVSYLDTLIQLRTDGVFDLRPGPQAGIAAA